MPGKKKIIPAIYIIRNIVNNKIYIGSAVNYKARWTRHKTDLLLNRHDNKHLQHAYNKYGKVSFSFEILENIKEKSDLITREQIWLDFFKPDYNICKKANSPQGTTYIRTAEIRLKMRNAKLGKPLSEEHKRKISDANKGRIKSPEECKQISLLRKGKSTWSKGLKLTEAHKAALLEGKRLAKLKRLNDTTGLS